MKEQHSRPIAPWVGVDLDGTIAQYDEYQGPLIIGEPIEDGDILNLVRNLIDQGTIVKIFTARVSEPNPKLRLQIIQAIEDWCVDVFGVALPVTCVKDYGMLRLYDDRAVQVKKNTGRIIGG